MAIADLIQGGQQELFKIWVFAGVAAPFALLLVALLLGGNSTIPAALAGVSALGGLLAYENAYVRAGQSVPLS
jgi:hypothetical protein